MYICVRAYLCVYVCTISNTEDREGHMGDAEETTLSKHLLSLHCRSKLARMCTATADVIVNLFSISFGFFFLYFFFYSTVKVPLGVRKRPILLIIKPRFHHCRTLAIVGLIGPLEKCVCICSHSQQQRHLEFLYL